MKDEAQQILKAMSPAQKLRAAERLYCPRGSSRRRRCARNIRIGPRQPSSRPFGRFSSMPEANLFLMFTQRLNTLGAPYMISGSVAIIDLRRAADLGLKRGKSQGSQPTIQESFIDVSVVREQLPESGPEITQTALVIKGFEQTNTA